MQQQQHRAMVWYGTSGQGKQSTTLAQKQKCEVLDAPQPSALARARSRISHELTRQLRHKTKEKELHGAEK